MPLRQPDSLLPALALGGDCMIAWCNPDAGFFPTGGYEIAHDTGRWWDAMLRLEAVTGRPLPADLEAAMLANLQALMSNPDGLLMCNPSFACMKDRGEINPHNFREAFLSLAALVRYRDNACAREAGHRLAATLDRLLQPDGRLDFTRLECWGQVPLVHDPSHSQQPGNPWFDGTATGGRAIEALLVFHEATGDDLAFDVAERLARHHFARTLSPDGAIRAEIVDPGNVGHNHSYLGTLRGLLLYGLTTGRADFVDAVARTYRNGLWGTCISPSGHTPHDLGTTRFPDAAGDPVGESASAGDVAQIALWLALRAGHVDLLDDVERLVRARLLPSQIPADEPDPRLRGGWGVYADGFGRGCILDVLAAVVHTLCDLQAHIVTETPDGVAINLHFEAATPLARVASRRAEEAEVEIVPRIGANLLVRLPAWTPPDSVHIEVGGVPAEWTWCGSYASIPHPDAPVTIRYALPEATTVETLPVSGREYRLTWRGDEVLACDPPVPIY